jgi:hypothetical protein
VLLGKNTPKTNILDEFQRNLFILPYCMIMDVVFGDLYSLEHFKVKYAQKSNKSLRSAFYKEKFIFFFKNCFKE